MERIITGAMLFSALLLCVCQPSLTQEATTYKTVASFLNASKSTTFSNIVKALGLTTVIEERGYTIFVPTDKAFASFLSAMNISAEDADYLMETFPVLDLVRFHISPQPLTMDVLPHGQKIQTYLKSPSQQDKLRLTVDKRVAAPKIVIRGWESFATVTTPNVQAGKSIIHVVDNVLLPALVRDKGFYPYNLLDMMVYHKTSYFQAAVGTIGIDFWDRLKMQATPVTVLIPTDAAFIEALDAFGGSLDELKKSGKLVDLMNYHISDGYGPTSRMVAEGSIKTWKKNSSWVFKFTKTGDVLVQGEASNATVVIKDSFTGMGSVVHIIDNVLRPKGF